MGPLDLRTDSSLCQALTCAELRYPRPSKLPSHLFDLAVGLRYALIGIAAAHFVLLECDPGDKRSVVAQMSGFGGMIRASVEQEGCLHPHRRLSEGAEDATSAIFDRLFERYLDLISLYCPIDLVLSILIEEFGQAHAKKMRRRGWPFPSRSLRRSFDLESQQTLKFAICFFERRKFDVEEVPEIALLGE